MRCIDEIITDKAAQRAIRSALSSVQYKMANLKPSVVDGIELKACLSDIFL